MPPFDGPLCQVGLQWVSHDCWALSFEQSICGRMLLGAVDWRGLEAIGGGPGWCASWLRVGPGPLALGARVLHLLAGDRRRWGPGLGSCLLLSLLVSEPIVCRPHRARLPADGGFLALAEWNTELGRPWALGCPCGTPPWVSPWNAALWVPCGTVGDCTTFAASMLTPSHVQCQAFLPTHTHTTSARERAQQARAHTYTYTNRFS